MGPRLLESRRFARFLGHAAAWIAVAGAVLAGPQAVAQEKNPSLVRDAETEQLLREYAVPIFRAAGINANATKIILVNDRSFNAFVANGQKIFINVGALMDAETPNEIIGVIAHETGHIAGRPSCAAARADLERPDPLGDRHACRRRRRGRRGEVRRTGSARPGRERWASLPAARRLVRRSLLAYQRSEEQAADSAAVRYLSATGQSPKGMLDTFAPVRRQRAVPLPRRRPLSCEPSPADRARQPARAPGKAEPEFRQEGSARPSRPATISCAPSCSASSSAATRFCGAIRLPTPRRLRAMPGRCSPTRAADSRRPLRRSNGLLAEQPDNRLFSRVERAGSARKRPGAGGRRAAASGSSEGAERRSDPGDPRTSPVGGGRHRRSDPGAHGRDEPGARISRRISISCHGLRPQRQYRAGRTRIGPRVHERRRHQERADPGEPRHGQAAAGLSRLFARRRHTELSTIW